MTGSKAFLTVDSIKIDGTLYSHDKTENIPLLYRPLHTKTVENTVIFFTKQSPLSNFHQCQVIIEGTTFTSVEQFVDYKAATHFGDQDAAMLIMQQTDPTHHRQTIKQVKRYDKTVWLKDYAPNFTKLAMEAKFTQNRDLGDFLRKTGNKVLGESNPSDYFWGTGLSMWAPNAAQPDQWTGENNNGKLLMDVRTKL